jgi:endonuclease-3
VTQNALGGHSIPLNKGAMITLRTVGVISDKEFAEGVVPGLERAVPKNKGAEVGSLLHQLGVEVGRNPYGPNAKKLMLEIDPNCKDRLPKKAVPKPPEPEPVKPPAPVAKGKAAKGEAKGKAAAAKEQPAKKAHKEVKKPPTKHPAPTKKPTKVTKKPTKKGTKKPTTRRLTKKKPR